MKVLPLVSLLLIAGLIPAHASDDRVEKLAEEHRIWLEEEVTYIISKVERETFLTLETEQEFQSFIQAFWRKRDSNPTTLENEFQIEHYERLEYANEFFGRETFRPGWETDRGRYHIVLGPPVERQNYTGFDSIYPSELWFYNEPALKRVGLPPFFYLLFFQRGGFGEFEMFNPTSDEPQDLLTGYQTIGNLFREDIERAYNQIYENISPELAHATLSFRTDEGDVAEFQAPSFGTMALLDQIAKAPFVGVDTSYADHFDAERGVVESDYLFTFVESAGRMDVLPGPGEAHYLHWVIEVEPQHVGLVKDDDRGLYGSVFILSAQVVPKDDPDHVLFEARKESFMSLRDSQLGDALQRPFAYSGMFPVAPGSYDARIIWRNRACPSNEESACRKAYSILESSIEVPKWGSDGPRLAGTILGYGVDRPTGEPLYRPYRFGSLEFLPNPRRVYSIGDSLTVLCEVSGAEDSHEFQFRVFGRPESPGDGAEETLELEKRAAGRGLRLEPMVQDFELEGLDSGRYRLVVDLLGAEGEVLDSRVETFEISPRTALVRPGVRGSWSEISPEIPGLIEMELGKQYLNLDQKETARTLLETSLAANPRMPPVREALATLLLQEHDSDAALEVLAPIRQHMPDRYETLVLVGEALFEKASYVDAVSALERAASTRRLAPRALRALAQSYTELGDVTRARELVEAYLQRVPGQPQITELLETLKSRN